MLSRLSHRASKFKSTDYHYYVGRCQNSSSHDNDVSTTCSSICKLHLASLGTGITSYFGDGATTRICTVNAKVNDSSYITTGVRRELDLNTRISG